MQNEFFKSINIKSDIHYPERLRHYYPTTKTLSLISSIYSDKSTTSFVIAPYGSGKSLAASIGGVIVNNAKTSKNYIKHYAKIIEPINSELGEACKKRSRSNKEGKTIVLYGYVENLHTVLAEAFDIAINKKTTLPILLNKIKKTHLKSLDRLAFIWDEFGRHLEILIQKGEVSNLDQLQVLAEWCSRQKKVPCSLNILMHQTLQTYAARLTQEAGKEWAKIGGRFNTIRFVDRSKEIYGLLGKLAIDLRTFIPPSKDWVKEATLFLTFGWFEDFSEPEELAKILEECWPISAPVLKTLPILTSRLAQNERSLLDFLREYVTSEATIGLEDLYVHFSPYMQEDNGIGGFYRQWLECESARSKCDTQLEREILAAACLLQLGLKGERVSSSKKACLSSVKIVHHNIDQEDLDASINNLIDRNLLLYRKRTDDLSVWHGIDIDLRQKLEERVEVIKITFNLQDVLSKLLPPKILLPQKYNTDHNITRYALTQYISAKEILGAEYEPSLNHTDDAKALIVLAQSEKEINQIRTYLKDKLLDPRIVHIVPKAPIDLSTATLEVIGLQNLLEDRILLQSDPLHEKELQDMYDKAVKFLYVLLQPLLSFNPAHCYFFLGNKEKSGRLSDLLSSALKKAYYLYFPICDEQFVRKSISRSSQNIIRKLIWSMLEYWDTPALGYEQSNTSQETRAFRTLLKNTSLISVVGEDSMFPTNDFYDFSVDKNKHRKELFHQFFLFFSVPSSKSKSLLDLQNKLVSPPFGLRKALFPLLFTFGLKRYAQAITISNKGVYLKDITGQTILEICDKNNIADVFIHVAHPKFHNYIDAFTDIFYEQHLPFTRNTNKLRAAHDYINAWIKQLPKSAQKPHPHFDQLTSDYQYMLLNYENPFNLLIEDLPSIGNVDLYSSQEATEYSYIQKQTEIIIQQVKDTRIKIDSVIDGYTKEAIQIIYDNIALEGETETDLIRRVENWNACFPPNHQVESRLSTVRPFLNCLRRVKKYTPSSFALALSWILVQKGFEDWEKRSVRIFKDTLTEALNKIEHEYIFDEHPSIELRPYIRKRISHLSNIWLKLISSEERANNCLLLLKEVLSAEELLSLTNKIRKEDE